MKLSKFFFIVSVLCYMFLGYLIVERFNPKRVTFASTPRIERIHVVKKSLPVGITIASVNISLPIVPAKIVNNDWEVTKEGVSYLSESPIPGEKGNSIMYGHNWWNLLGRLPQVKPGDVIEITYADKTKKVFDVEYTIKVTPDQTHILAPSSDNRITLYTCTDFMDSKRFVVVGILREEKAPTPIESGPTPIDEEKSAGNSASTL